MPTHASFLYSRNIANFLALVVKEGELTPDFDDEIVAGTCVVRAGQVIDRDAPPPAPAPTEATATGETTQDESSGKEAES